MNTGLEHMAGRILLIAAIVLGAYIAFIGVVVFTLHVIDWVKDWRAKGSTSERPR